MGQSRGIRFAALIASMPLTVGIAQAQDIRGSATPTSDAKPDDDIIVTANKRSERLQDVPKSVQVISAAALQQQNITDIADLGKLAPTIQGSGQTLSIRGVATAASSVGAQSKVGLVLDDVPLPSRSTLANNLQDIARVEVLSGPQGTLAGRNATGGLINLVTRGPSSQWEGFANALGTTDRELTAAAFLSGPISDTISISSSQYYDGYRGLYRNAYLDKWATSYTFGTRNKIRFQPSADLSIEGTFYYQRMKRNGVGNGGGQPGGGTPNIWAYIPANFTASFDVQTPKRTFSQLRPGITPSFQNNEYSSDLNGTSSIDTYGGIAKVNVDIGGATLTSITSLLDENAPVNGDFFSIVARPESLNIRPEWDGYVDVLNTTNYFTQELRLASSSTGRVRYVAGAFYSNLKQRFNYQRYFNPVDWLRTFKTRSYALYGHVDADLAPQVTLLGGIRVERDEIGYVWRFLALPAVQKITSDGVTRNYPAIPAVTSTGSDGGGFFNYDFGLQYRPADTVMLFATYAHAEQGPIYDAEDNVTANTGQSLTPLPPEKVRNIELGLKSQLFDRKLTLNFTLFDAKYQNYQVQTNVAQDNGSPPVLKLASVGSVQTRGIELTANARLSPRFNADLFAAYIDSKILSFPLAPCYIGQTAALGCNTLVGGGTSQGDLGGLPLANAPEFKGSLLLDYAVPLGGGFDAFAAPLIRYATRQRTDLLNGPSSYLPDTTYVDLNVGVRKNGQIMELFVKNLFDDASETYNVTGPGMTFPATDRPRSRNLTRVATRYGGARVRVDF